MLSVLGVAMVAAGAVAVFATSNEAGSAALVTIGALCVAMAAFWERLKSVEAAGLKVELVEAAQKKLISAKEAELKGHAADAARLRAEAHELLSLAGPLASEYEHLRRRLPAGPERTSQISSIFEAAIQQARDARESGAPLSKDKVRELFATGNEGNRIMALGYMKGDPSLADAAIAMDTIVDSLSAFEQTQALAVAWDISGSADLDPEVARRLINVSRAALESEHLKNSVTRRGFAEGILKKLGDEDAG